MIIGVAIGYVITRALGRKEHQAPYMPIFRHMDMPNAPPPIHNIEAPLAGRRHRGKKIDVETGDLVLEEPHQQEYWVVKRGEIIDLYLVDADEELR